MAEFALLTGELLEYRVQTRAMDRNYYSVDTANNEETKSWADFNNYIYTCAAIGKEAVGYFTFMPIRESAAQLIQRQELREEDITPDHMLAASVMHNAQYLYLPAITVKDYKNFRSRQAVAALMSGMASYLLNMFDVRKLKAIYANPTTFQGNHFIRKMGFKPLHIVKKPLSGMDIYYMEPGKDIVENLRALEKRYAYLISANPWPEIGQVTLEEPTTSNEYRVKLILDEIENAPAATDGPFIFAKYRDEYIGVAHKQEKGRPSWYGLHPRWRGRGLGAKFKSAIESL